MNHMRTNGYAYYYDDIIVECRTILGQQLIPYMLGSSYFPL